MCTLKTISTNKTNWWLLLLWVVLAFFSMSTNQISPFFQQLPHSDSAIFITCAQWMNDGLIMYKDMFDHKGPYVYVFDLLGLSMGYFSGVWLLCVCWVIVSTIFCYKTCLLFADIKASSIAASLFLLMVTRTGSDNTIELIALPFICYCQWKLLCSIVNRSILNWKNWIVIGVILGVVLLIKPNLIAGPCLLLLAILPLEIRSKKWESHLTALALGGLLSIMPPFLYLLVNDALQDFISAYWLFNIEYSAQKDALGNERWYNFLQLLFLYIPCLVCWVHLVISWAAKKANQRYVLLLCWLLISALANVGLSGYRFGHYLLPIFPIFALFVAQSFHFSKDSRFLKMANYFTAAFFISYSGYHLISGYQTRINSDKASTLETEIADYVMRETKNNDTILLWGLDTNIYTLTHRHTVTKYFYHSPIFSVRPTMRDEFVSDIVKELPQMILVKKETNLLKDIIGNNYTISSVLKDVIIYQKKDS